MTAASMDGGRLLTPRQLEVLELLAKGLTNREIGGVLGISPGTAKVHVAAIIEALDVTNRTEAASRLHELGLASGGGESRQEFTVSGFGSRPAIAVMPFDNLSSDPEHAFLADGLVEDLITRLAGWRWFPVIARNSTFAYKGRAFDVREVSQTLGARYVVEGSLRQVGDRLRLTVQALDGETAQHVWAQHVDCRLDEIFETQDEVVDSLVATLEPALARINGLRVLARRPEQLDAWENLQRGWALASRHTWNGLQEALPFVARAREQDPHFVLACSAWAYIHFHLYAFGRRAEPKATVETVAEAAGQALEIDASDPFAHVAVGLARLLQGDYREALAAFDRSLELGPSLTWSHLTRGIALAASGRGQESTVALEQAIRLSPQDPLLCLIYACLGNALVMQGRVDEALDQFRRSVREAPELPHAYPWLATALVAKGEIDEARSVVARLKSLDPEYSPYAVIGVFTPPEILPLVETMLEAAGWTDAPP